MMGDTAANDAQPAGGRCRQASTTNQRSADLMQQHRHQVLRSHWQPEVKQARAVRASRLPSAANTAVPLHRLVWQARARQLRTNFQQFFLRRFMACCRVRRAQGLMVEILAA